MGEAVHLAVTDLNFYLGKVRSERFPFPLNRAPVDDRLKALADEVHQATGLHYTTIELAEGLLQVANANMANAIRTVSTAKGYDPREYVLVPFGGAAGQHACAVAQELGIRQILHHPDAGMLSAFGIGLADHTRHRVTGVYRLYSAEAMKELAADFQRMEAEAIAELENELPSEAERFAAGGQRKAGHLWEIHRRLDLRYEGLDASLTIDEPMDGDYAAAFNAAHQKLFGYLQTGRSIEIVAARVEAVWRSPERLRLLVAYRHLDKSKRRWCIRSSKPSLTENLVKCQSSIANS